MGKILSVIGLAGRGCGMYIHELGGRNRIQDRAGTTGLEHEYIKISPQVQPVIATEILLVSENPRS